MAIVSMDGLVTALPGQILPFYKPSVTTKGAGLFHSLWRGVGTPGAGAIPATGSGQTCSSVTAGAMRFANPGGADLTYLARAIMSGSVVGSVILYDRLVTTSGLVGNSTGTQTVDSEPLTRYTSGEDVQLFVEWYTATGATASSITVNYTNDAGTTGQVTEAQAFQQTPVVGQMQPIALNNSDGIRRVESISLSSSTGTAGNFGITLARRLLTIPLSSAASATTMDAFAAGMAKIENNACLAAMVFCSATSSGNIFGEVSLIQG
jgi:hypothetical protein